MIDIHSHILPELDDGSQSLRESLAMARMAVESGVTAMVVTPHCEGNRVEEVRESWLLLKEALEESEIPLKLYPGMEIFGTAKTLQYLQTGKLMTLNGSRYPLVEFSFHSDAVEETEILHSLCKAGYVPIVAHPERYSYVQRDPGIINRWYQMGCCFQINRGSLLGRFGRRAGHMSLELVARGFASAVASDAHSNRQRTPWMEDIWNLLSREVSPLCARTLLKENPSKILKSEQLLRMEPEWF